MFDEINLLPDKMRDKERDLRSHETPLPKAKLEYSRPKPVAHEAKGHNDNLSWWQKLYNTQVNLFGAKEKSEPVVSKNKFATLPPEAAGQNLSAAEVQANQSDKTSWWQGLWSKSNKPVSGVMQKPQSPVVKKEALADSGHNQVELKADMLSPVPQKNNQPIQPAVPKTNEIPPEPIKPLVSQEVKPVRPNEGAVLNVPEKPKIVEPVVEKAPNLNDKMNQITSHKVGQMPQVESSQFVKSSGRAIPPNIPLPDVNLIPSEQRFVSLKSTYIILISSFAVAVLVVVAGYYGLTAYRNNILEQNMTDQKTLITEQDNLEKEIGQSEMSLAVKMRLDSFTEVVKRHLGWNEVFNLIENNTLTSIGWTNFAGDAGGKVSMSGEAPNYTAVAKQLKAFQDISTIKSVDLTGLGQKRDNSNIITFQLVLTLDPNMFVSTK